MRALIQRVHQASVQVDNLLTGEIQQGLLIFVGIEGRDTQEDVEWLASKITRLRIFDDGDGFMSKSIIDLNLTALVISQFTLHASTKKGTRPSFHRAAPPDQAIPLYESFVRELGKLLNKEVATGKFGAHMDVSLINDGPVTLSIDTHHKE